MLLSRSVSGVYWSLLESIGASFSQCSNCTSGLGSADPDRTI
jgi:hypothetical protein